MSQANHDKPSDLAPGPKAESAAVDSRVRSGDAAVGVRPLSTDLIRSASGSAAALGAAPEVAGDRGEAVFAREPSLATLQTVRSRLGGKAQIWE